MHFYYNISHNCITVIQRPNPAIIDPQWQLAHWSKIIYWLVTLVTPYPTLMFHNTQIRLSTSTFRFLPPLLYLRWGTWESWNNVSHRLPYADISLASWREICSDCFFKASRSGFLKFILPHSWSYPSPYSAWTWHGQVSYRLNGNPTHYS